MENTIISNVMRLLAPLKIELKLELLSRLSESIKKESNFNRGDAKENLLNELSGAWSDTGKNLADEILNERSFSKREISFE